MRRKINKEDILQAGLELMYLNGYGGTGIKDITDRVEIPKGSFYNHFKSKEAFGIELIEFFMEKQATLDMEKFADPRIKPLKRIKLVLLSSMNEQKNNNHFKMGCLIGNFAQELADVDDSISKAVWVAFSKMKSGLQKCLQEAIDGKDINSNYTSGQLADYIINGWQGAMLRMKVDKNTKSMQFFLDVLFERILI